MRSDTCISRTRYCSALVAIVALGLPASVALAAQDHARGTKPTVTPNAATGVPAPVPTTVPPPESPPGRVDAPLVRSEAPVPFDCPPSCEFRIDVGDKAQGLDLKIHVVKGSIRVLLRPADSPKESGAEPSSVLAGELKDISVTAQTSPPLQTGAYSLSIDSPGPEPASGAFVASVVYPVVPNRNPRSVLTAFLEQPPGWLAAVLSVASLFCLGVLFIRGLRAERRVLTEVKKGLSSVEKVSESSNNVASRLVEIDDKVKTLPANLVAYLENERRAAAAAADAKMARSLPVRVKKLLESEPTLAIGRMVREVAQRAGGAAEAEFKRSFSNELKALEKAEALLKETTASPDADLDDEWAALQRAIGALQSRHNPRYFLDVVDEAGRHQMAQKKDLLAALGLEEMSPPVGMDVSDPAPYYVERTIGEGTRSVLDKVILSGYKSKENGEVFRKPAIVVRLESDAISEVRTSD